MFTPHMVAGKAFAAKGGHALAGKAVHVQTNTQVPALHANGNPHTSDSILAAKTEHATTPVAD
jgi:hypothetical protein